ncbi:MULTISPECIES: 2-oxo acid dehydrogenase subunit E2 [unclassified Rhizobium]|uniref:dihydrolipoamide acetyltransferase family protein n=1 Tax=unclassified Rhizobium TaxID=2613769 RepID=UPI00104BEB06|nr:MULTISPECIES: 2-oxo acid dehydrogenase subunit E2 [unclassified Rhizobium]MBB3394812.1 2-oxoglutarate dehydrogenase E2 component (dihydrolipoamide succinyltransferase) [Rhizobium sp. BK060]MBB4167587.1 2-oxoglutarate dehydrogenase E2 component (dihydrolipoamide succinyltransferase) [Rhizobium sp. BK538]TCM78410.1 2-oxoglutarate dehydrogenase E2 component (dihydrolipoamide succinyltransferase) [Rhizobium sp. BK068]
MADFSEVLVPVEQEGTKAVVRNWLKQPGEIVAVDDPLVELETDKVTQEISAPAAGILDEIVMASGTDAAPGAVLCRIRLRASTAGDDHAPELPPLPSGETGNESGDRFSPAVRSAGEQYGIDPAEVVGTGRDGRVTRIDMDAAFALKQKIERDEMPSSIRTPITRDQITHRSHMAAHTPMRLSIARHMLESVTTAPHVTAIFEADFSAIIKHRDKSKAAFAADGINLSFTAYIIAACVAAMRAVPEINSRWHDDHLEVFDDINIGVGMALGDKGLVVPVVRQVQDLSLAAIAARLQDLTIRGRAGGLTNADMRGGTFTISNHGVSGSLIAAPIIINQPQSAILGVGKMEKRVVVREVDGVDTIQIRPMTYVSLTIDHRALDAHQTNAWLTRFVETLEGWPA